MKNSIGKKNTTRKTFGKYAEECVLASLNILTRSLSFFDLVTDIRLLYLSSQSLLLPLTVALFITILLPYILSYSVGIRIHFIHNSMKNDSNTSGEEMLGLRILLNYLFILPFGILYYIFLDFLDLIFTYFKGFRIIFMQDSEQRLALLSDTVSKQIGIGNKMNYEGIKRQKSTAQLLFESIPQIVIQGLLAFEINNNNNNNDSNKSITRNDIYLSMFFAILNIIVQTWRIILEKNAINESFIQYCVTCLTGRIGWIPFRWQIETILTSFNFRSNSNGDHDIPIISYDIRYDYPLCISKILHKKGKITFDFSHATMKELLNVIKTTQTRSRNNQVSVDSDNIIKLKINFGKSLRLLSFEMLMLLFKVCKENHIQIIGMKCDSINAAAHKNNSDDVSKLVGNAVNISAMKGNDIRLLLNSRDAFGVPHLFDILNYQSVFVHSKEIFYSLIKNSFDINTIDENDNESIVYKLIRTFDITTMKYAIQYLVNENKHQIYFNYFNHLHQSPLFYAIYNHHREKTITSAISPKNAHDKTEWMYDILTQETHKLASVNFPVSETPGKVRSPIGLAIDRAEYEV